MKTKGILGPMLAKFLFANGILTISTSVIILTAIVTMLDLHEIGWIPLLLSFSFILTVTTVFFFVIYRQGSRLRAEQERLVNVFEHITDGVAILDAGLNVVQSNPAARTLLGLEEGTRVVNFCGICSSYPGAGKMCIYDQCFLSERTGEPVEVKIKQTAGTRETVSVLTSHYLDQEGRKWYVLRIQEVVDSRRGEQARIAKMVTHSIMQAQEKERKRISRELHDGIGQSLYSFLIQLDLLGSMMEEEGPAADRMVQLQSGIRQTIEDIRHLSAELRPSVLDDMGLVAALRNYIQDFGHKFGIQVNFSYEGDKSRLPPGVETALYRIAQEAMTNSAKYANADRIDVMLVQEKDQAVLTVRDFGAGFQLTEESDRGVGLYSMEERAEILGGSLTLDSEPGKGTTVRAALPLTKGGDTDEDQAAVG